MRTVSVVNQFVPHYRVPVWECLRASLAKHDVRMRLLHGRPHRSFAHRGDTVKLDWSEEVPMREFRVAGKDLVYLELGDIMQTSDLVITNQEIRLLHNFRLLWQQTLGHGRLALMGHGRDRSKNTQSSLGERVKIWMSRRVHWWFAYNNYTAHEVEGFGYPADRITTFMNSTDTRSLRASNDKITNAGLEALRRRIGLGPGPYGVYVGAVDPIKQVRYLIQAVRRVREALPDFELMIVGAGSDREQLRIETSREPWVHWIPPQFGESKVKHMLLAQLCLMPAWVGLGIVDAFALGIPLVTTDRFPHSVEIDYLKHGVNGWVCSGSPSPEKFGEEVVFLLQNPHLLRSLRSGALEAGERFSVEAMVEHFTAGVLRAIDAPPRS
jgi:L-malate glycosyltransferase